MSGNKNVGIDERVFVVNIPKNLKCSICKKVLYMPSQCSNGHPFCSACIREALSMSDECPVEECKTHLTVEKLSKSLYVRDLIGGLQAFCPSCDNLSEDVLDRCQWIGEFQVREDHHVADCEHFVSQCPIDGCEEKLQRRRLAEHMSECQYRMVDCEHCSVSFQAKDLFAHEAVCESRPVDCVNSCGAVLAFNQMGAHTICDCSLQLVDCPLFKLGLCKSCPGQLPRKDLVEHVAGASVIAESVLGLAQHAAVSADVQPQLTALSLQVKSMMDMIERLCTQNVSLSAQNLEHVEQIQLVTERNNALTLVVENQRSQFAAQLEAVSAAVDLQGVQLLDRLTGLDSQSSQLCDLVTETNTALSKLVVDSRRAELIARIAQVEDQTTELVAQRQVQSQRFVKTESYSAGIVGGNTQLKEVRVLSAAQYVEELGLSADWVQDIECSMDCAYDAWWYITGGNDEVECESNVFCRLLMHLGETYNEAQDEQLHALLSSDSRMSAAVFVDWYIRCFDWRELEVKESHEKSFKLRWDERDFVPLQNQNWRCVECGVPNRTDLSVCAYCGSTHFTAGLPLQDLPSSGSTSLGKRSSRK